MLVQMHPCLSVLAEGHPAVLGVLGVLGVVGVLTSVSGAMSDLGALFDLSSRVQLLTENVLQCSDALESLSVMLRRCQAKAEELREVMAAEVAAALDGEGEGEDGLHFCALWSRLCLKLQKPRWKPRWCCHPGDATIGIL